MDPNAALRTINDADRVDAEIRVVMQGLHDWLGRGGFAPDWKRYPTGAKRYRRKYGTSVAHSTIAGSSGNLSIGDIVQRVDINGRNRYVITNIRSPWIYTRRLSGSGGPGTITFPSEHMLRKVG